MSQIKAIETNYAGCRFRSRLEARWAVFFDRLGVPWEYEPQGFEWPAQTVDDGYGGEPVAAGRYLPDFWLPSISTWFEVKGQRPSSAESTLHRDFHRVTDSRHICAWGSLPSRLTKWGWEGDENSHPLIHVVRGMERDGGEDFHYLWCVCPICGKPGIEFDGRGARVCRWTHAELAGNDKGYTHDHPRIREAFVAALSARFEHGESGAP